MRLSVVIPCGSAAQHLTGQLEALAAQRASFPWETILAVNSPVSREEVRGQARRFAADLPALRVVDALGRQGPAHARNAGARAARGAVLAFVDADDEVAPGWLAAIAEAVEAYGFAASRFDLRGLNPDWALDHPQERGLQRLWYPPRLPHAGACGLGVRRAVHEAVGGFDERWPVLEDTHYCIRVQLAGTSLHFAAGAVVRIRLRRSPGAAFAQARRWGRYNMRLYREFGGGVPVPQAWRGYCRGCSRAARSLLHARSMPEVIRGCFQAGWHLGILEGALRYAVPPAVAP
jgi:glycosyltransferase involved in cell wall biosynthesis